MIERRVTETTRPAIGPMDLNAGKADPSVSAKNGAITLSAIFVFGIGIVIFSYSIPTFDPYLDTMGTWLLKFFGIRLAGILVGALISVIGLRFSWYLGTITVNEWQQYQYRKSQWHNAQLRAFQMMQGVETIREYSKLEFNPSKPADMLLIALYMHYRMNKRTSNDRSVPYSVNNLGEIWLGGSDNSVLLGKLTGIDPEKTSKLLADLHLVQGRKANVAGNWVSESYDQVFDTFAKNWPKVANKPIYIEREITE